MPRIKFMTKEIEKRLPPLGATEGQENPLVIAKWFTPDAHWTWYAIEYDPEDRLFFGYVVGDEAELGYFSRDELERLRGPWGLPIERDKWFRPQPLHEVVEKRP